MTTDRDKILKRSRNDMPGAIKKPPLPLAHLYRSNGAFASDLLDCLTSTDLFDADLGIEFGSAGPARINRQEPRSGLMPRLRV